MECSVGVNAVDLGMMGATLANGGVNPKTGKRVMKAEDVPELLAVMATAGFYDESGEWMYTAGLPAKTGVGGGIVAVVPGKYGHRGVLAAPERGRQQHPGLPGDPAHFEDPGTEPVWLRKVEGGQTHEKNHEYINWDRGRGVCRLAAGRGRGRMT